tara:strand:+ start:81 stop:887 length:807 start_codon:yes stop_codon:yes gene_type:complete
MIKITETDSLYDNLETMSLNQILENINKEDTKVPCLIKQVIPEIEKLISSIVPKMKKGGRLFYLGAGTSGRLGILDASECPPTYGVSHDIVIGLIAGGDSAIRRAVEFAEDDKQLGWKDLCAYNVNNKDTIIGIAASGSTPYVVGALKIAQENKIQTGCITCNKDSQIVKYSDYPIEIVVGPEFVTGSTRMKSGTAQKLVLNMISTSIMIKLGKVKGNKMVDMKIANNKLVDRGVNMIMREKNLSYEAAKVLLKKHGSVRKVIDRKDG